MFPPNFSDFRCLSGRIKNHYMFTVTLTTILSRRCNRAFNTTGVNDCGIHFAFQLQASYPLGRRVFNLA